MLRATESGIITGSCRLNGSWWSQLTVLNTPELPAPHTQNKDNSLALSGCRKDQVRSIQDAWPSACTQSRESTTGPGCHPLISKPVLRPGHKPLKFRAEVCRAGKPTEDTGKGLHGQRSHLLAAPGLNNTWGLYKSLGPNHHQPVSLS